MSKTANEDLINSDCVIEAPETYPETDCEEELTYLEMDCEEQYNATFDADEFQRGINEYSFVCGALTALCNSGLTPAEAIEYIVNVDTIKHNLEVTRIGADATIESSKYASIKGELENI